MAKAPTKAPAKAARQTKQLIVKHERIVTGTSQDIRHPKFSTMNKHKKRNFKAYRGQGRPS